MKFRKRFSSARRLLTFAGLVATATLTVALTNPSASASTITWTLSPNILFSDGGTLNGFFGIYSDSGFVNGNPFNLTTAGGTTNFNQTYTSTINASDPNNVTVDFFAPNPAYSSSLTLTFQNSLLIASADNPLIGGVFGPSYECEGYSCTLADTRYVVSGFANSGIGGEGDPATTPLPAALPLFVTGLGALGLLGWRRKRKTAAAIAA